MSSGIIPGAADAVFPVQTAANTAPGTYHYICLVHPGCRATSPGWRPASPPDACGGLGPGRVGVRELTANILVAERAAQVPTSTVNAEGSRTWTVHVGLTVDDVDLLEYLPTSLPIHKGDWVNFDGSGATQEPHTVTTSAGAGAGYRFSGPNQCEVVGSPDTTAQQLNGPRQLGCADPSTLEQVINVSNQGELNTISSAATGASAFVSGEPTPRPSIGDPAHVEVHRQRRVRPHLHDPPEHVRDRPRTRPPGGHQRGHGDSLRRQRSRGLADGAGNPIVAITHTLDAQGYLLVTAHGHTTTSAPPPTSAASAPQPRGANRSWLQVLRPELNPSDPIAGRNRTLRLADRAHRLGTRESPGSRRAIRDRRD